MRESGPQNADHNFRSSRREILREMGGGGPQLYCPECIQNHQSWALAPFLPPPRHWRMARKGCTENEVRIGLFIFDGWMDPVQTPAKRHVLGINAVALYVCTLRGGKQNRSHQMWDKGDFELKTIRKWTLLWIFCLYLFKCWNNLYQHIKTFDSPNTSQNTRGFT